MAEQAKKSATTVVWSDTVSIENAQKKKQELLKAFNSSEVILLDISKVEDLDISAVQLILASEKEALMRKKKFKLVGEIPQNFVDFFCRIGIPMDELITSEGFTTEILETVTGDEDA
ncbi:MAG: STAS domain-containing protein [Treponema sp.]|nr:STAS domain-containing protein [Treponema sp.]